MCRQVTCKICGKASWAGCGMHVEQVLGHLPKNERCPGHAAGEKPQSSAKPSGFLRRLIGG